MAKCWGWLALVSLLVAVSAQERVEERVAIPTGGSYRFFLPSYALLDWRYLWSNREVTVQALELDTSFEVYLSNSETALQERIYAGVSRPDVYDVSCSYESKGSLPHCSFTLSYYGFSPEWWLPRLEYLFEAPPPTHVALVVPERSLFSSSREVVLDVASEDRTIWQQRAGALAIGVSLYLLSGVLSGSIRFYLAMWFVLGAVLSLAAILLAAAYVGLSVSPRLASLAGVVTLFFAMSWGTFYYTYVVNLFANPAQHK